MTRGMSYCGKRALDLFVVAAAGLPAACLTIAVAIAVKLDDGGPIIFQQVRVGRDGNEFRVVKFRTMHAVPDNPLLPDASTVTRVGRFLRRSSLDEVPQLLNVLRGDMSVVGPRPTLPYQVARYTLEQRRRHDVRPGLTGLAQVSGRNALLWSQRIELDLEYLEKQSLLLDIQIVLRSLRVVITGGGVEGHPVDDPLVNPVLGGAA